MGYCFTCQRTIDPVALVAAMEGVTLAQASDLLCAEYGISNEPDPDEQAVRNLLAKVDRGPAPSPQDIANTRRAAAMARRALACPPDQLQALLQEYDVLDLTDIDPQEWLARPNPCHSLR